MAFVGEINYGVLLFIFTLIIVVLIIVGLIAAIVWYSTFDFEGYATKRAKKWVAEQISKGLEKLPALEAKVMAGLHDLPMYVDMAEKWATTNLPGISGLIQAKYGAQIQKFITDAVSTIEKTGPTVDMYANELMTGLGLDKYGVTTDKIDELRKITEDGLTSLSKAVARARVDLTDAK
jgi:hypothetical protein